MPSEFLYGSDLETLQNVAFERASEIASDNPRSVVWLEQNDHRSDQVVEDWATSRKPLRLAVSTLDRLVGEMNDVLNGPSTRLDALTRRQIIEQGLRELHDDGTLKDAHRFRDEVLALLTTLEGEGYDSIQAVEKLIDRSELTPQAANVLEKSYARFLDNRERTMTGDEFTGSQGYRKVLESDESVADLLPNTDVIVISGYYTLSFNQRRVIECLADSLSIIAVLPLVNPSDEYIGADAVASEAAEFYRDLADETHNLDQSDRPSLAEAAGRLYTPATSIETTLPQETLRWVQEPTPDREVRQVARAIRNQLANDNVDPEDILVVVPGLISYREHIEDIFTAHEIEAVTFANKLLYQTHTGSAMLDLVTACEEEPGADLLARLATNPTVSLEGVDSSEVADLARRLPTNTHERLLDELDESSRTVFGELLDLMAEVKTQSGVTMIESLRALFEHVNLPANLEAIEEDAETFDARMERRAFRRVDRTLDAIARVVRELGVHDVLESVSNELDQLRVPPPRNPTDGAVEVVGPRDAFMKCYDHLYLIGLTAQDFPPNPNRPRLFEELEEGLEGIEIPSERDIARYQFATMLTGAESVYITTPETTTNDEPLLESAILDELSRVTGLGPEDHHLGNGCLEDVQRAVGQQEGEMSAREAVEHATETGVFDGDQSGRVRRGVATAESRAAPERTDRDGLLQPETFEDLHPPDERIPYSPTQLTQYARCGFQYYMERVLDIEAPEDYKLEPDPLDLGSLVHDILEAFYTDFQKAPGEGVDLATYDQTELQRRMLRAGERTVTEHELPFDDSFFDRWLQALFAGLGDPESNDHYHADDEGIHAESWGLLARFLEVERERESPPGWFEVSMGLSDDPSATLDLPIPDGRTIPIGGRIDRITVDWSNDPPKGIVHDYKTGTRSARQTVDGIEFQLPLYALAAGHRLEDEGVDTPLDAAFYVLDPPTDVSEKWTLRYYISVYGDGTDADYEWLTEVVTPDRVAATVDGIEGGAFGPTVLDEQAANCRYCDYSDICDVRYHRRRDVIDAIDSDDHPGYVPQYARPDSLLDEMGGEE